jgi:hypothetical protein
MISKNPQIMVKTIWICLGIALLFVVLMFTVGCSNIKVKRTYSLGYQGATASVTFEPGEGPDTKQVIDPVQGPNFGVAP